MKFSGIVLATIAQLAAANKKAKGGSAMEMMTSCPNFSGSSTKSGRKGSKAGALGGTADCGSTTTTTFECGDDIRNDERVYLLKDLMCDGEEDVISLYDNAVLDCGGRTIRGEVNANSSSDIIVELHDNASVINCNFLEGYHAIETFGDGCMTIENVSVYDSDDVSFVIEHSGTVVLRDVSIFNSGSDGIRFIMSDEDSLHAILDNVRVIDSQWDGIDFNGEDGGGDVVADFYGNIFIWDSGSDNICLTDSDVDVDITVYGNLFVGESDEGDGIDLEDGNSITFAAGSFSEICDNDEVDIESTANGRVFVDDGAVVICDEEDGGDDCTDSCDVDEALACIE